MAKPKIKLDHKGIAAVLNSGPVREAVNDTGDKVAAAAATTARAGKDEIECDARPYTAVVKGTARPASKVAMKHPAAKRVEAKRGTLTKAAKSCGLDVKKKVVE